MGGVTIKEYENAKKMTCLLKKMIEESHERLMNLSDAIVSEKQNYDLFKEQLKFNEELIVQYEIQQKLDDGE